MAKKTNIPEVSIDEIELTGNDQQVDAALEGAADQVAEELEKAPSIGLSVYRSQYHEDRIFHIRWGNPNWVEGAPLLRVSGNNPNHWDYVSTVLYTLVDLHTGKASVVAKGVAKWGNLLVIGSEGGTGSYWDGKAPTGNSPGKPGALYAAGVVVNNASFNDVQKLKAGGFLLAQQLIQGGMYHAIRNVAAPQVVKADVMLSISRGSNISVLGLTKTTSNPDRIAQALRSEDMSKHVSVRNGRTVFYFFANLAEHIATLGAMTSEDARVASNEAMRAAKVRGAQFFAAKAESRKMAETGEIVSTLPLSAFHKAEDVQEFVGDNGEVDLISLADVANLIAWDANNTPLPGQGRGGFDPSKPSYQSLLVGGTTFTVRRF